MAKLSDVAAINPTRKVKKGEFVPFVEMAALPLSGRDISPSAVETRIAKASGAHFQNGDTLLARITPCLENGKTAQVNMLPEGAIGEGSTEFIVLCGHDSADNDFVYYLCRDPEFRNFAISRMEGTSGRQRVAWQSIANYEFELPPPEVRRAAAEVLAALDNRIDNLRQSNATLEAIAAAQFKSRFVDFDGVPAEDMQELEFGFIPTGWELSRLGNECSYLNRGISPKYIDKGGVLVLNQKCIRDFAIDTTRARRHDPAQRSVEGREIQVGDVLVNSTGVGTLGRVAQVLSINEPTIVDSHVTVVRAGQRLSWTYLGQWFSDKQSEIEAMGEGSTGQTELSRSKLAGMPIVVPDRKALADFDAVVAPLKARIALADSSSRILTVLRDTLLPRLISGKLQLKDAERPIGTAI